jgi:hypothetical protein|tara:strand:- start:217 stop:663 length:447 start_codon:yes stop_codon:yes gene_type:complete
MEFLGMDFISWLVMSSLIVCAIGAPVGVFLIKPTASPWLKSGKLLFPIFLLCLTLSFTGLSDCFQPFYMGCVTFKMFLTGLAILGYTMYLGWFEYIWRRLHKQIVWPLKENLQYGVISNIVILISGFMTLLLICKFLFEYMYSISPTI